MSYKIAEFQVTKNRIKMIKSLRQLLCMAKYAFMNNVFLGLRCK